MPHGTRAWCSQHGTRAWCSHVSQGDLRTNYDFIVQNSWHNRRISPVPNLAPGNSNHVEVTERILHLEVTSICMHLYLPTTTNLYANFPQSSHWTECTKTLVKCKESSSSVYLRRISCSSIQLSRLQLRLALGFAYLVVLGFSFYWLNRCHIDTFHWATVNIWWPVCLDHAKHKVYLNGHECIQWGEYLLWIGCGILWTVGSGYRWCQNSFNRVRRWFQVFDHGCGLHGNLTRQCRCPTNL